MLTAPRPDFLATADERIAGEQLNAIEAAIGEADTPERQALEARVERLRGTLTWRLRTRYHERLTEAFENLDALNADVAAMQTRYESFVRARQAAVHSYRAQVSTVWLAFAASLALQALVVVYFFAIARALLASEEG